MFKDSYKAIIEKVGPRQELIEDTITRAEAAEQPRKAPIRLSRKAWIPAAAAVLVFAVVLAVMLAPSKGPNSFTLTAYAAGSSTDEPVTLRDDVYVSLGELKWAGGGYSTTAVEDEFYTDITVTGENIRTITYSMPNGKIGVLNSSRKIIDSSGGSDNVQYGNGWLASAGFSYYDYVTCSYNDRFTADDKLCITVYGTVGEDFDAAPVLRYLDVGMMRAYAHSEPITLTAGEISKVTDDYFNELLKNAELDITVEYTDGSRETRAVRFSAGCNVYGPVTRRFLAYSVDENGDPYPVHSLSEARQSFELTADIDWEQNADYRRLSKLSTDEDIIEFEDFIVEPTLKAIIVK